MSFGSWLISARFDESRSCFFMTSSLASHQLDATERPFGRPFGALEASRSFSNCARPPAQPRCNGMKVRSDTIQSRSVEFMPSRLMGTTKFSFRCLARFRASVRSFKGFGFFTEWCESTERKRNVLGVRLAAEQPDPVAPHFVALSGEAQSEPLREWPVLRRIVDEQMIAHVFEFYATAGQKSESFNMTKRGGCRRPARFTAISHNSLTNGTLDS